MKVVEQVERWVNGESVHNKERDECCPDFSCCESKVNTPVEARQRYQKAYLEKDEKTQMAMLGMFLSGAISTIKDGPEVYISGDGAKND